MKGEKIMATHRGGHKPGGGLHSNKTVHKPQPRVRAVADKVNVAAASQMGVKVAFVKEPLLQRGAGYNPPRGPTNNLVEGPGAGREIHPSGSQHSLNKNPNAPEPGRSLFQGPNIKLG
jgi:hypothetical protein